MKSLIEKISAGDATLVVYSPDAIRSGLVGMLDQFIAAEAQVVPSWRTWVRHTDASIEDFYRANLGSTAPTWYLVSRLFSLGPSLATVWLGPEAAATIPSIKGRSHPAIAAPNTIRSKFWCDNPVCNLVHVSDDSEQARRELEIVQNMSALAIPSFSGVPVHTEFHNKTPVHCGIRILCEALHLAVALRGHCIKLPYLESDEALTVVNDHDKWLKSISGIDEKIDDVIEVYFKGTSTPSEFTARVQQVTPLDEWDALLVGCAQVARAGWNSRGLQT